MMPTFTHKRAGFTLTELIMAVTIIATILAAVILYLDPIARQRTANNAKRAKDVGAIADSLILYALDGNGGISALNNLLNGYLVITNGDPHAGGCASIPTCDALTSKGITPDGCVNLQDEIGQYVNRTITDPDEDKGFPADVSGYFASKQPDYLIVGACSPDPGSDGTLPSIQALR